MFKTLDEVLDKRTEEDRAEIVAAGDELAAKRDAALEYAGAFKTLDDSIAKERPEIQSRIIESGNKLAAKRDAAVRYAACGADVIKESPGQPPVRAPIPK